MTDFDLLHEYAARKSEESFATLVNRYVNLVYSAALRQTRNPHIAEEITQAVFIILARKAGGMRPDAVLSGWLLRTTRFVALNSRRRELHRLHTEQESMNLYLTTENHSAWEQIAPLLDEALVSLGERDRNALALRFFEHKSFKEIGETLGTTEDNAQKRVSRAVEKLRDNFAKHGFAVPSALIVGAIFEGVVQAAPSTLAASAATAAMSSTLAAGPIYLWARLAQAAMETAQIKARVFQAAAATLTVLTALLVFHQLKATSTASPAVTGIVAAESGRRPMNRVSAALPRTVSASTQPNSGELLLRVLDSENETPVANARLTLVQTTDFPNRLTNVLATDPRGECLVPIDHTPVWNWNSRIEVFKDGYVPKYVSWSEVQGDDVQDIPAEYTTKLMHGVNIGGIVVDAKGKPVADARIVFSVSGLAAGGTHERERLTTMDHYHTEVADGQGRWRCSHVPTEFGMISYEVIHPDYITAGFVMTKFGLTTNSGSRYLAEEELRNGTATMILKPGLVVAGAIVDERGKPIAAAKVTYNRNWYESLANQVTGSDGRFRFSNASDKESILTVQADGFSPRDMTILPNLQTNALLVALSKGAVLRGNVVDESGVPVAMAAIHMSADELNRERFSWTAKTDDQGRFEWLTAPTSQEYYVVSASGFESQTRLPLTADGTEHLITMRSSRKRPEAGPVRLSGTVVDAETKQPVASFRVLMGVNRSVDIPPEVTGVPTPSPQPEATGKDGKFSVKIGGAVRSYILEIAADGYQPVRITGVGPLTNDCQFALELKSGGMVSGTVFLPDGTPAVGATAMLCTEMAPLPGLTRRFKGAYINMPGEFNLGISQAASAATDMQGRFSFQPKLGMWRIVVAHNAGYGEISPEQLIASPILTLQPWGRVAGTLKIGNQIGSQETVCLDSWHWRQCDNPYLLVHLQTKTDAEGRFIVEGVPPGDLRISHRLSFRDGKTGSVPVNHGMWIEVKAGQTTQVALGGTGRTIVGSVKVMDSSQQIDWRQDVHTLTSKLLSPTAPKRKEFASDQDYIAANKEWKARDRAFWLSEEGREAQRHSRQYTLSFGADGSFKIDDVLPGTYDLNIRLSDPNLRDSPASSAMSIVLAKRMQREITVPDTPAGEVAVLDLGVLEFTPDKL